MLNSSEAKVRNLLLSPAKNLTTDLEMPINYRNLKEKHYTLIPLIRCKRYITW
jgi:hypothetical protein